MEAASFSDLYADADPSRAVDAAFSEDLAAAAAPSTGLGRGGGWLRRRRKPGRAGARPGRGGARGGGRRLSRANATRAAPSTTRARPTTRGPRARCAPARVVPGVSWDRARGGPPSGGTRGCYDGVRRRPWSFGGGTAPVSRSTADPRSAAPSRFSRRPRFRSGSDRNAAPAARLEVRLRKIGRRPRDGGPTPRARLVVHAQFLLERGVVLTPPPQTTSRCASTARARGGARRGARASRAAVAAVAAVARPAARARRSSRAPAAPASSSSDVLAGGGVERVEARRTRPPATAPSTRRARERRGVEGRRRRLAGASRWSASTTPKSRSRAR